MRSHESSPDNCWRKQCDQCAESYQGNARSGGQCYRQVHAYIYIYSERKCLLTLFEPAHFRKRMHF